jgi:hypothetical protein
MSPRGPFQLVSVNRYNHQTLTFATEDDLRHHLAVATERIPLARKQNEYLSLPLDEMIRLYLYLEKDSVLGIFEGHAHQLATSSERLEAYQSQELDSYLDDYDGEHASDDERLERDGALSTAELREVYDIIADARRYLAGDDDISACLTAMELRSVLGMPAPASLKDEARALLSEL